MRNALGYRQQCRARRSLIVESARAVPDGSYGSCGHSAKHSFAAGPKRREHELRAVLTRTIEDEVDSDLAPHTRSDGDFLEEFRIVGPGSDGVAVNLRCSRPGFLGLHYERAGRERDLDEVRKFGIFLGIPRHSKRSQHLTSIALGQFFSPSLHSTAVVLPETLARALHFHKRRFASAPPSTVGIPTVGIWFVDRQNTFFGPGVVDHDRHSKRSNRFDQKHEFLDGPPSHPLLDR